MFKVSKGNSKIGKICNINMPALITCRPGVPCSKNCYACKGFYNMPSVKACYKENLRMVLEEIGQAEIDISNQLPKTGNHYCRLHSSGDFVNMEYLEMLIRIAKKFHWIKFKAFTKKYELVNEYFNKMGILSKPRNFTIIFSGWEGLTMVNPYNFPTAWVKEFSRESDIKKEAFTCTGHCDTCYHCWNMVEDDQVLFHKH